MRNDSDEIQELSAGKRLACNLSAAGVVLAAGLFLLLCGLHVIPLRLSLVVCCAILTAVGLMFLISAIISRNSVSFWLSFCFLVPALVEVIQKSTAAGYGNLYPLYIAIPAVASLFTMLFTRAWKSHLPVLLLFGVPAAIFALQSGGVTGWAVVLPVLVLYIGCLMLVLAIQHKKEDTKDE